MLSQIGFYSLILMVLLNFFNIFSIKIVSIEKRNNINYYCVLFAFFCISLSFICLILSYIISDFSNYNVFQNSHTSKPLLYKITGTWGNHEGSMLLWLLVMNIYSLIFSFNKKIQDDLKQWTIFFHSILIIGFSFFIIFTSNPFNINLIEAKEGLGLNPILQDPALAIHPPILYFGYVGFSLTLSLTLSGLVTNSINNEWAYITKKWAIFSWSMLTGGIALGSYWAYYELGWGGWWFWDPVENVSLMPWLSGLALVHTLSVVGHDQLLKRWSVFLAILCFSLSLIGTFLVRSGILTSVHTFAADTSRGIFILILFLIITGFSFLLFLFKSPGKNKRLLLLFFNKTTTLVINNIVMMIACLTVLLGTIYPIIIETLTNQRISVGAPYFNSTIIPIFLPGLLLMSIAPVLSWQNNKLKSAKIYFYLFLLIIFITFFISFNTFFNIWGFTGLFTAIWIISSSLLGIIKKLLAFKSNNYIFFLKNHNSLLAHLGVGVLILGVTVSSVYQKEYKHLISVNETIEIGKYRLSFDNFQILEKENFQSLQGTFSLLKDNKVISFIKPEKRYYHVSKIVTTEAAIYHTLLQDYYLVLGDKTPEGWVIKFYLNPFVLFIWLGAVIMIFSGLISVYRK